MSITTPTTELEAVNEMLSCISVAPVNDLETTGDSAVYSARNILNSTNRSVQQRGWHFNSEEGYPLIRNVDNELLPPPNTLKVSAAFDFKYDFDVVQRGTRLYDRKEHTFTFEKDIEVDIVLCLGFEELPEAARKYILIKAARTFQGRIQGSDTVFKFTSMDLDDAWKDLRDAEADTGNMNIYTGSASMQEAIDRFV